MEKSRLIAGIVITTILASLFLVYFTDNTVSATIVTPSVDSTASSHKMQYASSPSTLMITPSTTQEIIYATCYSKTSAKV